MAVMTINVEQLSSVIKQQLKSYEKKLAVSDVGTVVEAGDGVCMIYGLETAMAGELIEFPNEIFGMVMNLREDNVGCAILGGFLLVCFQISNQMG